jgi:hypothetical protein
VGNFTPWQFYGRGIILWYKKNKRMLGPPQSTYISLEKRMVAGEIYMKENATEAIGFLNKLNVSSSHNVEKQTHCRVNL